MANWTNPAPNIPPRQRRGSEILNLPYYHPNLKTMEEVREKLVPFLNENGYFVLRNSFSKKDTFTVSVMHDRSIKHFNVGRNPNGYYLQDKLFPSLDQLIRHHALEDVPNVEGVSNVRLLRPVYYEPAMGRPTNLTVSSAYNAELFGQKRGTQIPGREPVEHTDRMSSSSTSPRSSLPRRSVGSLESEQSPTSPSSEDIPLPTQSGTSKKDKSGKELKQGILTRVFRKKSSGEAVRPASSSSSSTGSVGSFKREVYLPPARTTVDDEETNPKRISADAILQRPPPPIPVEARSQSESENPVYDRSLYSRVEEQTNRAPVLAEALRKTDSSTKCECGLELEDSELPRGWSIHISHEEGTKGRIFFEGPRGQTSWNLPWDISLELSLKQQEFMRKLLMDVRAGNVPLPQPHGEVASSGTSNTTGTGRRGSAAAFNNSQRTSSSDDSGNGRGGAAGGASRRSSSSLSTGFGASAAQESSNATPDGDASQQNSKETGLVGTWC